MPEGNLLARLRRLRDCGVDFILVGGVAAVVHGAPISTFDVDVVYSREPANIDRLLTALQSFDAIFRAQPERRLRPAKNHLEAGGHLNLITRYGPLDVLGFVGNNLGYPELLPHSDEIEIAADLRIRVLNLETIISIKESIGSEKDLAVLPLLRRTLIEIRRQRGCL